MEPAKTLPTGPPEQISQDYERLRTLGLAFIQRVAAQSWTDHNAHDPGITMLEAFCYAQTEAGLRAGMELEDLIESAAVRAPGEFFTAAQVLPISPVTAADFQRVIEDHPLVRNAWVNPMLAEPLGQWRILLELMDDGLNSSTFSETISPPGLSEDYLVDIAFPAWDEPEVAPLQSEVTLLNAELLGGANPWQPIDSDAGFFARLEITYQVGAGPNETLECWVIARVSSPLSDPLIEIPQILSATTTRIETLGDNSPADTTLLKRYNRRITAAAASAASIRRFLRDYRNLGESFSELRAIRLQEVAVTANITVNDAADPSAILLAIFRAIDQFITPPKTVAALPDLVGAGTDAADVYDGPLPEFGLRQAEEQESAGRDKIYASDILRLIFQQRSSEGADVERRESGGQNLIVGVGNLALSNFIDNRTITTEARDCLQLVDSTLHVPRFSPTKSRFNFYRNGLEIEVDPRNAIDLFLAEKAAETNVSLIGNPDLPIPQGQVFPLSEFYPIQNDLPVVYGVGEAGLPPEANDERRGKARQLKGYLFFLEQLFAGQLAQLSQLNALFSANPNLATTQFQQPIYQIPDGAPLFRAFDPTAQTWEAFTADSNNAYVLALLQSSEDEDTFLDRRNRMLDHLLARQGEDLNGYATLRFREMGLYLSRLTQPLPDLILRQTAIRRQISRELLFAKSAFYYDLPVLNRDRFQSYGNPAYRLSDAFLIIEDGATFAWRLLDDDGNEIFQNPEPLLTEQAARRQLALVYQLIEEGGHLEIENNGGDRRVILRLDGTGPLLGVGTEIFPNNPLAQAAANALTAGVRAEWLNRNLIPLECRLYHELGLGVKNRPVILEPLGNFFEIYDEVDADPIIEKRFRLFSGPALTGDILLESFGNFPGPDDPTATADAQAGVQELIQLATQITGYRVEALPGGQFRLDIPRVDGTSFAFHPNNFATAQEAWAMAQQIRTHLFTNYAGEGFYLLENHLLISESGPVLQAVDGALPPYSQEITFIFPSGYSRDFSDPNAEPTLIGSGRYSDPAFRRYAEERVLQASPAHLIPRVWWVDRATPGTPLNPDDPAFNNFSTAFLNWLDAHLQQNIDLAAPGNPRDVLVEVLNTIHLANQPE